MSDKLTTKEAKLLFKIRTGMLDVRENFKNKYTNKNESDESNKEALLCQLCKNHVDNSENILKCSALETNVNMKFDNLFSKDIDITASAIKVFAKLWKIRQEKLSLIT